MSKPITWIVDADGDLINARAIVGLVAVPADKTTWSLVAALGEHGHQVVISNDHPTPMAAREHAHRIATLTGVVQR